MAGGREFYISRVVAAGAGVVVVPANRDAGRRLCVMMHEIVAKGFDGDGLTAQFCAADGAVDDLFVRAGFRAGRGDFILVNGIGGRMAGGRELLVGRVVASRAGVVGVPALLGAGRGLSLVVHKVVAKSRNYSVLTTQLGAADVAVDNRVVAAGFGAGRSAHVLDDGLSGRMAGGREFLIGRVVAARAGIVGFPTDRGAGRSLSLVVHEIVAQCRNGNGLSLRLKGRIREFCSEDCGTGRRAGRSRFCHRRIHRLSLDMACVVAADSGRRAGCVVRGPFIGRRAVIMAGCWNDLGIGPAAGAGVGLETLARASGRCRDLFREGVGLSCKLSVIGDVSGHLGNSRIPAAERIVVGLVIYLGGRFAGVGRHGVVFHQLMGQLHAFVHPGYGVLVDRLSVDCRVLRVTGNHRHRGRPAGEGVGVLGVSRLRRGRPVVGRRRAIGNVIVGLKDRAVIVFPDYGVGANDGIKRRRVCSITGHSGNGRIPACKGVGILGSGRLRRSRTVISRRRAVGHIVVGFQNRAVLVLPRHGVGSGSGCVGCRVGCVSRRGHRRRRPAGESVGVLSVRRSGRGSAAIGRHNALVHRCGGKRGAVVVFPRDRVSDQVLFPNRVKRRIGREADGCTVRIGRCRRVRTGAPAKESIPIPREGVGSKGRIRALCHRLRIHGSLATVGVKGDRDRVLDPHILRYRVPEGVAVHRADSRRILLRPARAVRAVVKLRGGDIHRACRASAALILDARCGAGRSGIIDSACALAAGDVCLVRRGIECPADVDGAVDVNQAVGVHLRILHAVIVLRGNRAGVICCVQDIDGFTVLHVHSHALINLQLRALQQEDVRIDVDRAGHCLNGEAARQRQTARGRRLDRHREGDRHIIQRAAAVHDHVVPPVDIGLRQRTGRDLECLTGSIANDQNIDRMEAGLGTINRCKCVFFAPCIDRHRNLDVSQRIRTHRENLFRVVKGIGCRCTAGIVHDHHILIDRAAVLDRDRSGTVAAAPADITIGIEEAAVLNRDIGILFEDQLPIRTDLTLTVVQGLRADTQAAARRNRQMRIGRKRQLSEQHACRRVAVRGVDMALHI